MIETYLRKKLQPLFDTITVWFLVPLNITPNMVTFVAFVCGIFAAGLLSFNYQKIALSFLMFSGLLDVLDGTLARLLNQSQKVGAYVDLISDRMVEAAIILGFAFSYPQYYIAYIMFFIAVLLHFSTFVVAGSLYPNMGTKSMHYDKSLVERAEAFLFFALMIMMPQHISPLLTFFNMLIFGSGITRFFRVLQFARTYDQDSDKENN